jgi:DNA-binding XRE family transcriptional regulator
LQEGIPLNLLLHLLREAAGKSQQELANHLHVDRATISRIEHGSQKCDVEMAKRWIRHCGGKQESESLAHGFDGLSMFAAAVEYFDEPA